MNIAITGASGLIGSALAPFLRGGGHTVVAVPRGRPSGAGPCWDPATGELSAVAAEGFNAVIHLAGENIAGGRWSDARKRRIRQSRADGTRGLSEALARLPVKPSTLIVASAIGFYGDRGDQRVDETSTPGEGFLPEVCEAWESAADPARQAGIRVIHLRFGIVLTPAGGALGQMLLPFKMGVGGVLGSGRQHMSWVAIDDVLGSILHVLRTESVVGPVNVVSPNAVTNQVFTKTLGKVIHRPTFLAMPAFAARLAFGEMADALLLSSTSVDPTVLRGTAFEFAYPNLEDALRHVLGAKAG